MNSRTDNNLFAANLWAILNFADPNDRYTKFLARGKPPIKSLLESILLYDRVVVPTQDFLSLAILVGVLGEKAILDMLESDRIRFLRIKGVLVYTGNGGGIQTIEDSRSPKGKSPAFCASVDEAVSWSLNGLEDFSKDPLLSRLAVEATQEIDLQSIIGEVRSETYSDILKSPYLRTLFSVRSRDMNKLAGIEPNQVRIYGGSDAAWKGDEIDMALSLATTNVELRLAQHINCVDMSTASPVGHVIKAKAQRSLGRLSKVDAYQSFATLREVAGIPDIGEGVLEKEISVSQITKLARSRNAAQFREWFHKNCNDDAVTTAREYVSLLREVPKIQSLPAKILRFVSTTALGAIPPVGTVLGALVGAVDSFFIEKWLRGTSPKYFIEDIRQLQGKPRSKPSALQAQVKTGRNDPCPCGSGEKYKKCCGNQVV